MLLSIARTVMLFFVYGFLGWCAEVAFAAIKNGHFVNRGFLNGTICPIYGFGLIGVVLALRPIHDNIWLLLAGSFVVTTGIELVTGFLMEKLFHAKWWDYSKMPLNIGGYVCLPFSLIWSVACIAIVRWVDPLFESMVGRIPEWLLYISDGLFLGILFTDLACTIAAIRKLSDRLKMLTEVGAQIHHISDEIGAELTDTTLKLRDRIEEGREEAEEHTQALRDRTQEHVREIHSRIDGRREDALRRLEKLRERFDALLQHRQPAHERLLRAFPNLRSLRNDDALQQLRAAIEKKRKK